MAGPAMRSMRGHRAVPHTADVRLEAWAPTRDECVAEAVLGLVESFADVSRTRPERVVTVSVPEGPAEDMLLAVLDEVIYRLDVHGDVPIDVEAVDVNGAGGEDEDEDAADGGGLDLRLAVAGTEAVEAVGAAPKAVSLHGLHFGTDTVRWSCSVTVDV
ncbi:archease [Streptomyces gobiensis]|uniref:archease n=1 Tax=Streptomyces gobiensis TaxID=2875706 RepID=UPI001E565ECE|nr:archease [Streptomyces gobiensis]UGY91312.1 archease [Streptomyces gobiensis]